VFDRGFWVGKYDIGLILGADDTGCTLGTADLGLKQPHPEVSGRNPQLQQQSPPDTAQPFNGCSVLPALQMNELAPHVDDSVGEVGREEEP